MRPSQNNDRNWLWLDVGDGKARHGFGRGGRTPRTASTPIHVLARIVANPSSDRMTLGFVRAVVPNSSTGRIKLLTFNQLDHLAAAGLDTTDD